MVTNAKRFAFAEHGVGAEAWKTASDSADRAREQAAATIVHCERMSAGAPQRPVHALLARLIADNV